LQRNRPALTRVERWPRLLARYANPHSDMNQEADDMVVVADVFSNGSAALADVVQAPRDRQMLADFEVALRQSAAFVSSLLGSTSRYDASGIHSPEGRRARQKFLGSTVGVL